MRNYILLHGAWHGSWCYYKLLKLLKLDGARVYALDLPGHYHHQDDFSSITLPTYVNYVVNFIASIHGDVVLVGHSMSGVVISQVAQCLADHGLANKIMHLVYISGFIALDGLCLFDEEKKSQFPSVALKVHINKTNCSISIPLDCAPLLFYNTCSKADITFALANLQTQPLLPLNGKVSLNTGFTEVNKTYIKCLQDNAIHISQQERMSQVCQNIISINSDHSPFFSAANQLADIILSI